MRIPHKQEVFGPYWNGAGDAYADPLRAYRHLTHLLDGDPNAVFRAAKSEVEPERFAALEQVITAAREVFLMVPFDPGTGQGAQEADCLRVVRDFLEWVAQKKTSGATVPDSPLPESPEPFPLPSPTSVFAP